MYLIVIYVKFKLIRAILIITLKKDC